MKKLILFTSLFLLPFFVFAQAELPGALGLTFGMNKASVKKVLIDKGGVFDASQSDDNMHVFTGITMGTVPTEAVACKFINDKVYAIGVIFRPPSKQTTQELFDKIESIVKSKYGEPESTREFIFPYKDGDGNEMDAISAGKGTIASSWTQFKNKSDISLEIRGVDFSVGVILYYTDGILMKEVDSKNASDF